VSFKEDPLQQQTPSPRRLWIEREGMAEARRNFWMGYLDHMQREGSTVAWREFRNPDGSVPTNVQVTQYQMPIDQAQAVWDISFAAAIAAFSFLMEGRTSAR
jgi:hypothetical protein